MDFTTVRKRVRFEYDLNLKEKEPPDDETVHMRFSYQRTDTYLCGLKVQPGTPCHGSWMPEDAYEKCPHCGQPVCPKCYDLSLLFSQLPVR